MQHKQNAAWICQHCAVENPEENLKCENCEKSRYDQTDQAVIHHGDEPSHKKTKYDDTGLDTNRKKTNDGDARPLTEGLEKKKGVGRNSEIELSADQTRFLTQYEYIVLSEWRALAPNSLRVLHPTTNDDDGFYYEWFYVGPPPYNTLCSSGPKEKLWPLFPSGDM